MALQRARSNFGLSGTPASVQARISQMTEESGLVLTGILATFGRGLVSFKDVRRTAVANPNP